MKKYLIKSLKWTKQNNYDTWYRSNKSGYSDTIYNAGIYTENDINDKQLQYLVKENTIEFVEITDEITENCKNQIQNEINFNKEQIEWLQNKILSYTEKICDLNKEMVNWIS